VTRSWWRAPARVSEVAPWAIGSPGASIAISALLLTVAFALRLAGGDVAEATVPLFVLPIAILSATFGVRGGLAAAVAAVVLVVVWAEVERVPMSGLGWAVRLVPLLLLGLLLGNATDRLRTAEAERVRLEDAARRHRDAVHLNDTIVQSLSAAKWKLEGGDLGGGLEIVTLTLHQSNRLVSDLIRGAELGPLWRGNDPIGGPP